MMNQDGIKVHPIQGRRTRGAPWSRLYSKRVWRNLRFPEDYWFEDTIQMFCIDTQYTERYIDKHLYRYRVNHGGISANASASKKGLDSYWICEEMPDWCRKLGVPFDQKLYECTIEQLGPLTWKRCMALIRDEHKALFTVMCDRLASIADRGHAHFQTGCMARFGMRLAYKELRTLQGRCSKTVIAVHRAQHLGIIPSQGKQ